MRVQKQQFDRRSTLKLLSATYGGIAVSMLPYRKAWAATEEPTSPFVRRMVRGPANSYSTYPHSNGFLPDGRCLLAVPGQVRGRPGLTYIAMDLNSGDEEPIAQVAAARMYFAISGNGLLVVPKRFGVAVIDLSDRARREHALLNEPGWTVSADLDVAEDGSRVLICRAHYDAPRQFEVKAISIDGENSERLVALEWPVDHAHFSPFDPSWICYAQSLTAPQRSLERMWIWNAHKAPKGRHIFNQISRDGRAFVVSHERAMFNKPAMLTIAHGSSAATPRGLYEVAFDGTARLISESNRDCHCNISRDGRWAVVSLQGAEDETEKSSVPTRNSLVNSRVSRNWLQTGAPFEISDVELVDMRSGRRAFLFRGTNAAIGQPYEVQPAISPDGKWVILKDAREQRVFALEIDQNTLSRFLRGS